VVNGIATNRGTATQNRTYVYTAYTGKYTYFIFEKIAGSISFRIPSVLKGYYRVDLSVWGSASNAVISASYGVQQLKQNFWPGFSRTLCFVENMGTINVVNNGAVVITFTCVDHSRTSMTNTRFYVDYLRLTPVSAP
jgi:hypothetical protein